MQCCWFIPSGFFLCTSVLLPSIQAFESCQHKLPTSSFHIHKKCPTVVLKGFFIVLMSSSVSLHGASQGSSEPAVCLTCSPGKNWHHQPDFRAVRVAPVQGNLPAAFLFPNLQHKWTSNNMAHQDVRQAKTNIDNFPASTMHTVGCFSIGLYEPSLKECGLSCLHAAGSYSVPGIRFTLSLKRLLSASAPQSGVDCTHDSERLGVQMMQDRVLTLSPLSMSKSYRQQTSKFAYLLIYY